MKTQNDTNTDAEESTEEQEEQSEESTQEDGDGLKWGFDEIFETDDDSTEEVEELDDVEEDETEDLRNEISTLKAKMALKDDVEKLSTKYGKREGFPEISQGDIAKFMNNDFSKIPPVEVGYIMANFSKIMEAQKKAGQADAKSQYSPEAIKSKKTEEATQATTTIFKDMGEQLKRQFGLKQEQTN